MCGSRTFLDAPPGSPDQTLAYGGSIARGPIICMSEITGMTCRNNNNGHYFRVSREGYELG